jgi:hypothetical protein
MSKNRFAFYNRTALRGHVVIDGARYLAYITDTGMNDADFRNDGIRIDLNQDGQATSEETVDPGQTVLVNGHAYRFDISW